MLKEEGDLVKVTGGAASAASAKAYRCPNCGSFCRATGEGVHIGSHSYYPPGLHWYYECMSCKKSYLECELDGTVLPWDGESGYISTNKVDEVYSFKVDNASIEAALPIR